MALGEDFFSLRITTTSLGRLSTAELAEAEKGVLFVAAPVPPRVGSRVRVEVAVGENPVTRQDGLVIWSRPARRGQAAGFRAQLENPSPTLLRRLKSTVETVRRERDSGPRAAIEAPVAERASFRTTDFPIETDLEAAEAVSRPRTRLRRVNPHQLALPPPLLLLPGPSPKELVERASAAPASPRRDVLRPG